MNTPKFYKTEHGDIINLTMITQMYKRSDGYCIVELVSDNGCLVTEEEMERIYAAFKFHFNSLNSHN